MKHIYNDYYLGTDAYNFILYQRKIKDSGKYKGNEYFDVVGFYGTNIKLLYNKLVDLKVLENIQNQSYEQLLYSLEEIIKLKLKSDVGGLK